MIPDILEFIFSIVIYLCIILRKGKKGSEKHRLVKHNRSYEI